MRTPALFLSAALALMAGGCGLFTSQPAYEPPLPEMRPASDFTWVENAIVRGPRDDKAIALVFTGGRWNDGTDFILDTLEKRGIHGGFYFTGEFINNRENRDAIERMIANGHSVGPHGDAHLLYASWENRSETLVTQQEFAEDLRQNIADLIAIGVPEDDILWWIPPYEWYNAEIVEWSLAEGMRLFSFSPGTLSHADYTEADAPNYRDSDTIFESIVDFEEREEDGLNGFFLFTHVGASPKRPDKFHYRLPELIDLLLERGYYFITVEQMMQGAPLLPEE